MNFSQMMQFMPMLEETKMEMYEALCECTFPILRDKNVIILMILIIVFQSELDPSVCQLQTFFFEILRSYVEKHTKNDAQYDLSNINICIRALPRIQKLMGEMF